MGFFAFGIFDKQKTVLTFFSLENPVNTVVLIYLYFMNASS